jgi:creatinine deaminase
MDADAGFIAAVEEARNGAAEGGVPIGAALVGKDGTILGRGHNMRVQKGSATLHVSPDPLLLLTILRPIRGGRWCG